MIQELVYTPFVAQRMTKFQLTSSESVSCCLSSEEKKNFIKARIIIIMLCVYMYIVFVLIQADPEKLLAQGEKINSKNISL